MKALIRSRFTWLVTLVTLVFCAAVALAVLINENTKAEEVYNHELHNALAAQQAVRLQDLADIFCFDQYLYLCITPPVASFTLHQPGAAIPILDTKAFPDSFIAGLAGYEDENGIRKFPVWIYEDASSRGREIVIETVLERRQIARISREPGYSPDWFARDLHPDFDTYERRYQERLLACYDPARVCMRYDLLIGKTDLIRTVWRASIDAALLAEEQGEGGGMMRSSWEGGTVSNLQFVATDRQSNGCVSVSLAYPDSYMTNSALAFEIFTCDGGRGLIDSWWEFAAITNVDTSTNFVEWVDTESSNSYVDVRFYAAAVSNDVDGDGFTDGFERYVCHTSVTNSNSYPVAVSGTISYTGSVTGPIRMLAVTESNSWVGPMATIDCPGSYTNDKVAIGTEYWFRAYCDRDQSKTRDFGEPWGTYSNAAATVTNNLGGVDIALIDRDEDGDGLPDWWEVQYFGSSTNSGSGDPDGDGLANSNEYAAGSSPTDSDTDDDGMGDGAEVAHGNSPSSSNIYATLPYSEDFQLFDVLHPASNAQNFGYAVAAYSNRILVGAYSLTNGSAFVFHWDGTNWTQEAQLYPWASTTNNRFGCSVGLSADFAVVGAYGDSINGTDSGAAYVYAWDGTNWANSAKLLPEDGNPGDRFGYSLAVASNVVVVGAPKHDDTRTETGAAYSFSWDGASWTNGTQKLRNTSGVYEWFGHSVSLSASGETLCVGENGYSAYYGRVNLYRWSGSNWTGRLTKRPLATQWYSQFGASVCVSDDALIVGAPQYNTGSTYDTGAAYIFEHQGTNWTAAAWNQTAMLCPSDLAEDDNFGQSVALIDSAAMVGTHRHAERAYESAGALYLYVLSSTNWNYAGTVARELVTASAYLGRCVAAHSGRFVSGAHGEGASGVVFSFPTNELLACVSSNALLRPPQWSSSSPHAGFLDFVCATNSNIALGISPLFTLGKTVNLLLGADKVSTIWIDFEAMITPSCPFGSEATPDMPDLAPWQTTYFTITPDGHPIALDGPSTWNVASNTTVTAGAFHRYTVKQEYGEGVWSLYVDGSNVLSNLSFASDNASEFSCYAFAGSLHAASYIDNISISTNQPDLE